MRSLDDRGVSDTLGFVFAFVLIVSTVGIVTAVGFGGLQTTRDAERVANAERAFDVLASNVEDVGTTNAPNRGTEIRLKDARLSVGDPVTMNVSVSGTDQSLSPKEVYPIVYKGKTETRLIYVNGAVLREEGGASVMLREPPFVLNDTRAVIPLFETYPGDGTTTVDGSTTVLVRAERTGTLLPVRLSGTHTVSMQINTTRTDSWYRYLDSTASGSWSCVESPGNYVRCSGTVDRVYVSRVRIKVDMK